MMGGRIATVLAALALSGLTPLAAQAEMASSPTLTGPASPRPPAPTQPVPATMASDRILGRADAPITIIEYASFTCSHCADFTKNVLPELKSRYIDTGKAKLVFRDLPTAPLQVSASLAAIGRCTPSDRFFSVADHLMNGQEAAFRSSDINGWIKGAITVSGRTEAQMVECLGNEALREQLGDDVASAQASGINGTPALFVNGRRVQTPSLEGMIAAIAPLVR